MQEGEDRPEEKVLMVLRKTRKAFIIEYGCGVLLLLFLGFLTIKGIQLKPLFSKAIIGLAFFSMLSAEYSRITTRYKITDTKITYTRGILKQSKKHIYFAPLSFLPNINFRQTRLQRLLRYGTISITGVPDAGVISGSFELRDINTPHKALHIIERWIDYYRNRAYGARRPDEK